MYHGLSCTGPRPGRDRRGEAGPPDFLWRQRAARDAFAAAAGIGPARAGTPPAATRPQEEPASLPDAEPLPADATRAVLGILDLYWQERPLPGFLPSALPAAQAPTFATVNTASLYTRALPDAVHLWLRLAEDFIAIQLVCYLHQVFPHLRNLLLFITSSVLMLICAISFYPMQPHRFLMLLCGVLIVLSAGTGLMVFVQMNRDETLSRIAKSEPGEVTWDRAFLSQILVYVVIPIFGLAATQIPFIGGALSSVLHTLK